MTNYYGFSSMGELFERSAASLERIAKAVERIERAGAARPLDSVAHLSPPAADASAPPSAGVDVALYDIEFAAAELWRHDHPDMSVFDCGATMQKIYRQRVRVVLATLRPRAVLL
jgi:hypothetical protein